MSGIRLADGGRIMRANQWLAAAAAALLSGCAGAGTQPAIYPQAVFEHRVSTSEVTVYWNCTQAESQVLRVEGVVQNIGGGQVEFAQVELVAVSAQGRNVGSTTASVREVVLQANQNSPFLLQLRTLGDEARFDLYYWYYAGEAFGFGPPGRREFRSMARDACSPTQHRFPKTS
jgi:hypothetical protein